MSNEINLLTLKTEIDKSSIDDFEKSLDAALSGAVKNVDQFNKSAKLSLNLSALGRNIKEIEAEIARLTAKKHEIELRISKKGETKLLTRELQSIGAELSKLGKAREIAIKVRTDEVEKARRSVEQFRGALASVTKIAAAFGGGLAAFKLADMARDAVLAAERYEMLGIAMENVGKNAGYSRIEMDVYVESLRKGGIAMEEARQLLTQMASAGIDLSRSMELARVAQGTAINTGLNSTQTFERLINGLIQGNTQILRNIGLIVDFEQAYKDMAASLGKSTDALTIQEKEQAKMNAVLQAGAKSAGNYEKALESSYKKMTSLPRYFSEISIMAGELGGGVFDGIINKVDSLTKSTHDWLQELKDAGELEKTGRKIGDALGTVGEVALSAGAGMALYKSGILDVVREAPRAVASINAKTTATVAEARALRDVAEAEYHRAYAAASANTDASQMLKLSNALKAAEHDRAFAYKNLDVAQKSATASARRFALAQTGVQKAMSGVQRIMALLGGPANIAIMAATYGVYKLMTAQSEGEAMASKYGTTIDDVRKYFDEYAKSGKDAEDTTKQLTEAQLRSLEAQKVGLTNSIEESKKELAKLTEWTKRVEIIDGQEVPIKFEFKTDSGKEISQEISNIIKGLDDTSEAAKDAGLAIHTIIQEIENSAAEASRRLTAEEKYLKEVAEKILVLLKKQAEEMEGREAINKQEEEHREKEQKANDETIKQKSQIASIQEDIAKAYEKTKKARIEGLNAEIDKLNEYIRTLEAAAAAGLIAQDAVSGFIDKASEARKELEKELEGLTNPKPIKTGSSIQKTDPIADLKAEYEARQVFARKTIKSEQELRQKLFDESREYHERYEQLLEDSYVEQVRKGKELSEAQIAELLRVQDVRKRLSVDDSGLEKLQDEYELQLTVARQTIEDAIMLESVMLSIRTHHLEQKKALLQMLAEAEVAAYGSVGEETKKAMQEVDAELDGLKKMAEESAGEVSKSFSDAFNEISQHINTMSTQLGAFFNNYYDARIDSLDESHKRELRMIDNRLEAEMAMYEEQLKEYEDLEERREEAKTEHEEKIAELNEQIQDHMTEEAYRAIQEQIADEEEKYNEKVAILDDEAILRDELLLAQETAEAEALARKEVLEKEYAVRRAQMERKQAIADKASSMFSATINIAQGITKAWAQGGGLFGHILAALVAAAGAIQIAAIAARPLPEIPSFFKGGVVGEANKHKYPNMPPPDNPFDQTLIWARKGERVLNLDETREYEVILRRMDAELYDKVQARHLQLDAYNLGAQRIEDNSVHTSPTMNMTIHPTREFSRRDYERMVRRGFKKIFRG